MPPIHLVHILLVNFPLGFFSLKKSSSFCLTQHSGQSWSEMQLAHIEWLENIATQLLTVLARDRFGDFVSDQVVAPVRESTAMALGHLIKLMPNEDLILAIINVLIVFADHSAWECRHGAFLGRYFLKICYVLLYHKFKDI